MNRGRDPEKTALWAGALQKKNDGLFASHAEAARSVGANSRTFRDAIPDLEDWIAGSPESALKNLCAEAGIAEDDVAYYWLKTSKASIFVRRPGAKTYEDIRDDMIAELQAYSPKYERRPVDPTGEHLLVLPMADLHIGKWCDWDETGHVYNLEEAVDRCRLGTDALVEKAKLFGIKSIVLCVGNDLLHVDTPNKTTTSGTPQDNHGTIHAMFKVAKSLLVGMIEQLALVAGVHLVYVPSNHDWLSGFMLADAIGSWFHDHPQVSMGDGWGSMSARHRKYIRFGWNLIMLHHNDGVKENDIGAHMANEAAEHWGQTKFRYAYGGHLHHKIRKLQGTKKPMQIEKDHIGFTTISTPYDDIDLQKYVHVEVVRCPSPPDGWHDRNGYTAKPAIECFMHHPTGGQVARFTHFF